MDEPTRLEPAKESKNSATPDSDKEFRRNAQNGQGEVQAKEKEKEGRMEMREESEPVDIQEFLTTRKSRNLYEASRQALANIKPVPKKKPVEVLTLSDSEDEAPPPPAPRPLPPLITPALPPPALTPFQQHIRGQSLKTEREQRQVHQKEDEKEMEMMMGAMDVKVVPMAEEVEAPPKNAREKVVIDLTLSDDDEGTPPPPLPHPTPITLPIAFENPAPVQPIRQVPPTSPVAKESVDEEQEEVAMEEAMGAMDIRPDEQDGNVGAKGKGKVVIDIPSSDDEELECLDPPSLRHNVVQESAPPESAVVDEEISMEQSTEKQLVDDSPDERGGTETMDATMIAPAKEGEGNQHNPEIDSEMAQIAAVESLAKALRAPSSSPDSLESTPSVRDASLGPLANSDRSTISLPNRKRSASVAAREEACSSLGEGEGGVRETGISVGTQMQKDRRKRNIIESDSEEEGDETIAQESMELDGYDAPTNAGPFASTSALPSASTTIASPVRMMARKSGRTQRATRIVTEPRVSVVSVVRFPYVDPPVLSPEEFKIAYDKWIADQYALHYLERSLTGPALPFEFDHRTQSEIKRTRRQQEREEGHVQWSQPGDTIIYRSLIGEGNAKDSSPCDVTLTSPPSTPFSPPFEIFYTNRVVYNPSILPTPAVGCGCVDRCSDEPDSECRCRAMQIEWSTSGAGEEAGVRSDHKGFAYRDGKLDMDHNDPIRECNSACGCPEDCPNRVVGRKGSANATVDIYWTGNAGWGLRLGEQSRFIERGTPIGVYAGELLTATEAAARNEVYDIIGRTYLFQLDHWSLTEAFGKDYEAEDEIDAYSYGNFTRFLNHRCVPNVVVRSVYIDEANLKRPLFVFVTSKDVYPLEELTISYYGAEDPILLKGERVRDYQRKAARTRKKAVASGMHQECHCGEQLCRGVMFNLEAE